MPRSLGGLAAHLLREDLQFWEYIKIQWGGGLGIMRWTTYPSLSMGSLNQNIDIDGGAQNWEERPFQIGEFQQLQNAVVTVNDLIFGNADKSFTDIEQQRVGGVRGVPVTVWLAFYPKTTQLPKAADMLAHFILYDGQMDRGETSGANYRVSLEPYVSPLSIQFPRRRFSSVYGFYFIPKPDLVIEFGNSTIRPPAPSPAQTGDGTSNVNTPGDISGAGVARVTRNSHPRVVGPRGSTPTQERGSPPGPGGTQGGDHTTRTVTR